MATPASLVDQVLDFYYDLFDGVFTARFAPEISNRIKRDQMADRVKAAARAGSESLIRYLQRRHVDDATAASILGGLRVLIGQVSLDDIGNPNVAPERQAAQFLAAAPCPPAVEAVGFGPDYRLALYGVARDLSRIGPVMVTWRKLGFPRRLEHLERAISEFEEITERMDAFGVGFDANADETFELDYREYILQRFYQVEAGTVRMSTQTFIDLRRLFVMPDVTDCVAQGQSESPAASTALDIMTLAAARELYSSRSRDKAGEKRSDHKPALQRFAESDRTVIIGPPGSGKSTFLEWLNLQLASAEELEFPQGGQQAIPLLLRVRQLEAHKLPSGAGLIAAATEGRDRAERMPPGWIERQMAAGRVVFMLDGLDETDPELRDGWLLPWFEKLCNDHPACRFVVSSCPVGYPPQRLTALGFVECEVCDFTPAQMETYTANWCTAIRLARNEPEREAIAEGKKEGCQIVESFKEEPHIADLARNPLMLSAICLVNYFEGGHLPQDRALLYRLCVEGLLHHWDQRRGIVSAFALSDKLRVCREVAIAMQADEQAEIQEDQVRAVFATTLTDDARANRLFENVRYRTGILIERRPGVFAFAHLTFQEYLSACGVLEGNHREVDAERLAREHADGRWNEVIALYCGIAPAPLTRAMIESLSAERGTDRLAAVLAQAYLAAGQRLAVDAELRERVLDRISKCPVNVLEHALSKFPADEVAPIANYNLGLSDSEQGLSESVFWLYINQQYFEEDIQLDKLSDWKNINPVGLAEISLMLHALGGAHAMQFFSNNPAIYEETARSALAGLVLRRRLLPENINNINLVFKRLNTNPSALDDYMIIEQTLRIITRADRHLSGHLHLLSCDMCSFLRNKAAPVTSKAVHGLVYGLDNDSAMVLLHAFADRIEQAIKSGRDPGWPKTLPEPARTYLERQAPLGSEA